MVADVPIVVLKIKSGRCASLGVVRTLGQLGLDIYVVYGDARDPLARSRYVKRRLWSTLLEQPDQRGVEWLLELGRRIGDRPLLIPTDDVASVLVSDHAEALKEAFRFPAQPPGLARSLSNKRQLHELAQRLSVPTPRALFPRSIDEAATFLEEAQFPVVVKSIDPELLAVRPAARSVAILRTRRETLDYYRLAESQAGTNLMIQEYVPGGPETVWMFNGYFDERSDCLFGATGRKIHQYQPYTGPTTLGEVVSNELVAETTTQFMRQIAYQGILDLGYRFDERDGQYKLLDVNPRIGATFRLFVGTNGVDVARAMYMNLTGQTVPQSRVREGRRWLVETTELPAALTYRRDGLLDVGTWLRSLHGIEEMAWFASDDPMPALVAYRDAGRTALGLKHQTGKGRRHVFGGRKARDLSMTQTADGAGGDSQATVDAFFEESAPFWQDLYRQESTYGVIHRHRLELAARWVDPIEKESGARALDVGCGAGHMAVALAKHGYSVSAIDRSAAMVELTLRNAKEEGVSNHVRPSMGDALDLEFPDSTFSVVVALGVLPWLSEPRRALEEMTRVLRPGGLILVNVDNRARLDHLIDPVLNPALAPLKEGVKWVLGVLGLRRGADTPRARARTESTVHFDRSLARADIEKLRDVVFGFGPYTFMGRPILSERTSLRVYEWMQRRADEGAPGIRAVGSQYMVLGRKRDTSNALPRRPA
jgi:D-aspartate ligase